MIAAFRAVMAGYMVFVRLAWFAIAANGLFVLAARAQTDFAGRDTVSAWIDTRMAGASGERGWLDGGFGKLRSGRGSDVGQVNAGFEWRPRLTDTLQFDIAGQYHPDALTRASIGESFMRWKPVPTSAVKYAFRIGRFFPPISLENDGPGWSPSRTLTSSAIDTWIGEELLVTGAEASVRTSLHDNVLGLTGALFAGADAAGAVLAYRGWALHDLATGGNAALTLPDTPGAGYEAIFLKQARVTRPGVEVDGRGGYYLRGDWRPPVPVALNLVYLYNPGNPRIVRRGQYGWTTRVIGGGVTWTPDPPDEVLGQYMWGSTKMGGVLPDGRHPADLVFDSAYALLSHRLDSGARLSLRADYFATRDHSFARLYDSDERGYAVTAAWLRPWTAHVSSALEIVDISSRRGARLTVPEPDRQSQTQVQFSLRLSD